jgi:hypothetical protein
MGRREREEASARAEVVRRSRCPPVNRDLVERVALADLDKEELGGRAGVARS